MKNYKIDIFRLSTKLHQFEFEVDRSFFQSLDQDLIENGKLKAWVDLEKNDRFIAMDIRLEGSVELTCDRSLDLFDQPINESHKMIFKYGDQEQELSEDMMMITSQTQQIDIGQYIFEFIGLAIPMKKLHPRYHDNATEGSSVVYTSELDTEQASEVETDPRWNELKRLKKK